MHGEKGPECEIRKRRCVSDRAVRPPWRRLPYSALRPNRAILAPTVCSIQLGGQVSYPSPTITFRAHNLHRGSASVLPVPAVLSRPGSSVRVVIRSVNS